MEKVLEYYNQGYNCAESIVKAFSEERKLDIPVQIATPFGSGMNVGSICGAITGAVIVLGALKGRGIATEKNQTRKYVKELMQKIKENYGTIECIEFKKKGISCSEIIEYTYNETKKFL